MSSITSDMSNYANPTLHAHGLYIGGEWLPGQGIPVVNPASGDVLAHVADASTQDALSAVEAAQAAAAGWRATPARQRAEILRRWFQLMSEHADELAHLIALENGKALPDAKGEVTYAAEFFRWYAEDAVLIACEFRRAPGGAHHILLEHEPIGVAVWIPPWNFPPAMATRKLGPALAAGCTVILKPARETPLTAAYVVDVLHRVGVPRGVVNLVTPVPTGPLVAAMLARPEVRKLSFTGSTEVGRELLEGGARAGVSA